MSNVLLDHVIATGLQDPASLVTRVQSIDVDHGMLAAMGFTVTADLTSVIAGALHRAITLTTNAQGDAMYHGDSTMLKDATRNIFKATLNLNTPGRVTASEPVVS